jgi:hypothetical protein
VCDAVAERCPYVEVVNTICDATELRQNEVRDMAGRHDCVLVIGGAASSNTRRLYEIAGETTSAWMVSDVTEVRDLPLDGVKSLGVTAGASTPDWLIHEVVDEVRRVTRSTLRRLIGATLTFTLYSKIFVAVGAYLLSYAVADNVGVPFTFETALLVSLYYLAMSLLNAYTARASLRIDDSRRFRFMHRWRHLFFAVFAGSFAGLIAIAQALGRDVLVLVLVSLLLGVAYNLSYLPLSGEGRRILFVPQRYLLAVKSLVISFAVTLLLTGLPLLYHRIPADPVRAAEVLSGLGLYFSMYFVFIRVHAHVHPPDPVRDEDRPDRPHRRRLQPAQHHAATLRDRPALRPADPAPGDHGGRSAGGAVPAGEGAVLCRRRVGVRGHPALPATPHRRQPPGLRAAGGVESLRRRPGRAGVVVLLSPVPVPVPEEGPLKSSFPQHF